MKELDPKAEENVNLWLKGDYDNETKNEIRRLLEVNPKEINDAFYTHLNFGTGGLRGIMGIGSNRMNVYTVRSATQGLANYILKQPNNGHSVLIGYDSRHHSREYAEEAAKVMAGNGIRVYLFKEMRPSPLVSFGCRYKHCSGAIMITASHNPPEYNGYKVYWNDGAQVLPPHDQNIITEVKKITNPSQIKISPSLKDSMIIPVNDEIDTAYLQAITPLQIEPEMNKKTGNQLKIVYTSLHGTGITIVPRALKEFGFSHIILVDSQVTPDGSFPTVKTPNPEEKEALQMGIEKLKETDSDLLIATDPDTDRIGVAVKHEGEVHLLNGNQFACLCTYYILDALSKQNKLPEKAAFVKTIGTTELLKAICHHFGRPCFDVLTGFKYIAEKIREWDLNPNGFQFIFGGEESFGYLLGTQTRDKDAISAAVLIAEAALSAKNHSKTLIDCLHEIYKKCGFYFEKLMTFEFPETKDGREAMAATMEAMRRAPPKTLAGIAVEWIEDFQKSIKTHLTTGKTEPIQLKTSDVLLFWLEDGSKLMIRPSGTEPKIKIYCGIKEPSFTSLAVAKAACEKKANSLIDALKTSKER